MFNVIHSGTLKLKTTGAAVTIKVPRMRPGDERFLSMNRTITIGSGRSPTIACGEGYFTAQGESGDGSTWAWAFRK